MTLVKLYWKFCLELSLLNSKFEEESLWISLSFYGLLSSYLFVDLLSTLGNEPDLWVLSKNKLFWEDIEEFVSFMILLDSIKLLN